MGDTQATFVVFETHKGTLDAVAFGSLHCWQHMQGQYWIVKATSKDDAVERATAMRSAAQ